MENGVGQQNERSSLLLSFTDANKLFIMNTFLENEKLRRMRSTALSQTTASTGPRCYSIKFGENRKRREEEKIYN